MDCSCPHCFHIIILRKLKNEQLLYHYVPVTLSVVSYKFLFLSGTEKIICVIFFYNINVVNGDNVY